MALKLRGDILHHKKYEGLKVCPEQALACIPDSLYMFLRVLLGGDEVLNEDLHDEGGKDGKAHDHILNIAQDCVYAVGGSWTPKHIGIALTLHQATRSKELVNLFHNAGHCINYKDVLKVDATLAKST